ncbi:hypothetical protein LG634_06385 [Streptomyces bambusae]|uniref:hypothetical protein n=1 Tax=Streptomyces bambusae TaxID=1550616 RepID=UPI001CFE4D3A|nr:hypothetical protein [Streptomyces bambusae]MCB5164463.1 hypothetical protein [Streptomyces bambusae]
MGGMQDKQQQPGKGREEQVRKQDPSRSRRPGEKTEDVRRRQDEEDLQRSRDDGWRDEDM